MSKIKVACFFLGRGVVCCVHWNMALTQTLSNIRLWTNKYKCTRSDRCCYICMWKMPFHALAGSTALSCAKWHHGHHF